MEAVPQEGLPSVKTASRTFNSLAFASACSAPVTNRCVTFRPVFSTTSALPSHTAHPSPVVSLPVGAEPQTRRQVLAKWHHAPLSLPDRKNPVLDSRISAVVANWITQKTGANQDSNHLHK